MGVVWTEVYIPIQEWDRRLDIPVIAIRLIVTYVLLYKTFTLLLHTGRHHHNIVIGLRILNFG